MPNIGFGGQYSSGTFGAGTAYSDGIALPVGRLMANGAGGALITRLYGYVRGNGGSRSGRFRLSPAGTGGAVTSVVTISSHSNSYPGSGYYGTNSWFVNGGTGRFSWEGPGSGTSWIGHGGSGTVHGVFGSRSGTLGGAYTYVMAPTAPLSLILSSDAPGEVLASWTAPSDNGGTAVTGYRLQYSKSATFASGVTTVELGAGLSTSISGLDAGDTYYFRVAAKNAVTTAAGSSSTYSTSANIPVAAGGAVLVGVPVTFEENPGAFWSLCGHNVGFNSTGEIVPLEEAAVSFEYYDPSTVSFKTLTVVVRSNGAWANDFATPNGHIFATSVLGDSLLGLVGSDGISSTQTIAFKTLLAEDGTFLSWQGGPDDSNLGTGQYVEIDIDPATALLTVSATRRFGGISTQITDTADISSLDLTAELAVYVTYSWDENTNTYSLYASVRESSDYSGTLSASLSYVADGIDLYTEPWEIEGLVRSLVTANLLSGPPFVDTHEWETEPNYVIGDSIPMAGPTLSYSGNAWEYLQQVASGTGCEISVVNGIPTVRRIGASVLDVSNRQGSFVVSPTALMAGRQVNISYSNATPVNLGLIYDASTDNNRTISVEWGEVRLESIATNSSPQTVLNPSPTGSYPNPAGTYYVIDSEGQLVPPADWVQYGGRLIVEISEDIPGTIDVTLRGPEQEIPGTVSPYTIGYKNGDLEAGTLKVIGSGLLVSPKILELLTGADPDKTPQQIASTIQNVAISTIGEAFDRGIWASLLATVRITLTGAIPISALEGFGLTAGSLIRYKLNIFRVIDVRIGNLQVDFTAEVHCTVADFDVRWDGYYVSDHDEFWSGYDAQDVRILPLRASGTSTYPSDLLFPSFDLFPSL